MTKPKLICVVGPTAVGKTGVAIQIANALNTEIISADSRQFYRELEIGTAKPTADELKQAKHHFVNNLSIHDDYNVGRFEKEVIAKLKLLFKKHQTVILVGGSGLFVDAVCNGLDAFPKIDEAVRPKLIQEFEDNGLSNLQDELKATDLDYYKIVDLKNPQRVIRALEVIRGTGKTFTEFRKQKPKERDFDVIKIGLAMEREELYSRIDDRMDQMIENGLFQEAQEFQSYSHLNALQTVGYSEIFGYLSGTYDKNEAVRLLKRNSRRYAKRQLTWFKRDQQTVWFNPNQIDQILNFLTGELKIA
ncbi:tRNA (adenosine(37)-N6)-dimethylallyltransferase MiaA [Roseivirga misakiensis]|uniref:tRNA dimethylallyltransferase n=1 Tax=Roseivirga misakiensis TaxID=1563681 RepID=A0A1E5SLG3_9BACT|nr:tRNA (adenosine(37)-N6)-dimethylallyltransferase MiaA [Roseivirga misakiensis]OEJ99968.1 tRNA (adenosine(37)-N6)-dimethylallyltransferase MiaA [Roseivirga misakiensis]